eukprot:GFUD01020261.1.p1 GENE.GFUD01020261.1~~GFUD01020261.1.p1  ORF type:complete len:612 (+),score=147.58 GFUD01020261.1:59-1894(+)
MDEPVFLKCVGFQENVVLALKSCFYEEEIRCLMIEKLHDKTAVYHARSCTDLIGYQGSTTQKVSNVCNDWFNALVCSSYSKDLLDTNIDEDCDNLEIDSENNPDDYRRSPVQLQSPEASDVKSIFENDNQFECSVKTENRNEIQEVPGSEEKSLLQCEVCTLKFRKRPSLNKHMSRKHKINLGRDIGKHSCDECGKKFNKLPSLRRHKTRKHSSYCEENILDGNLNYTGNSLKDLRCEIESCERLIFINEVDLKSHLKDVHNLPRKGRKPKDPIDTNLMKKLGLDLSMKDEQFEMPESCENCGKVFESKLKMYWHIKRVHQQKHKPCHLCGLMVKKLSDHIKRQHTEKDLKKFVCEFCGERFKGHSGYQFHIAGHTGEKKYVCRSCGKQFRTSSEAYNCERGHQGIFKWRCTLCEFKSHQKNKYVRHLRTHSKSQPYQCPMCDHRAARKDYLQKHIGKSHSQVSLDEIETNHPDLYKIEEKVQVTADIHYEKLELSGMSKLEKEEQTTSYADEKDENFKSVEEVAQLVFKVESSGKEESVKTDFQFKEDLGRVSLSVPYPPPSQALFTPSVPAGSIIPNHDTTTSAQAHAGHSSHSLVHQISVLSRLGTPD